MSPIFTEHPTTWRFDTVTVYSVGLLDATIDTECTELTPNAEANVNGTYAKLEATALTQFATDENMAWTGSHWCSVSKSDQSCKKRVSRGRFHSVSIDLLPGNVCVSPMELTAIAAAAGGAVHFSCHSSLLLLCVHGSEWRKGRITAPHWCGACVRFWTWTVYVSLWFGLITAEILVPKLMWTHLYHCFFPNSDHLAA